MKDGLKHDAFFNRVVKFFTRLWSARTCTSQRKHGIEKYIQSSSDRQCAASQDQKGSGIIMSQMAKSTTILSSPHSFARCKCGSHICKKLRPLDSLRRTRLGGLASSPLDPLRQNTARRCGLLSPSPLKMAYSSEM